MISIITPLIYFSRMGRKKVRNIRTMEDMKKMREMEINQQRWKEEIFSKGPK